MVLPLHCLQYDAANHSWKKLAMLVQQLRKCCNHPVSLGALGQGPGRSPACFSLSGPSPTGCSVAASLTPPPAPLTLAICPLQFLFPGAEHDFDGHSTGGPEQWGWLQDWSGVRWFSPGLAGGQHLQLLALQPSHPRCCPACLLACPPCLPACRAEHRVCQRQDGCAGQAAEEAEAAGAPRGAVQPGEGRRLHGLSWA